MKIGVIYPQIEMKGDPEAARAIGVAAEQIGYDHLLVYDHVLGAVHEGREPALTGPYTEKDPFHDPFVMFAYLAALTSRLELVTGVLVLPQRPTALTAKQAADLALFSKDRLRLGVGIGWNHVEYTALGQDFHIRGKRIEEQVPLMRRLWEEEIVTHKGRFDEIDRASLSLFPKRPIPIWFGGFSEPAYRRAARLGDGFMYTGSLESAKQAYAITREELAGLGKPESAFGREYLYMSASADPQKIADTLKAWRDFGGTHASFSTMNRKLGAAENHIALIEQVRRKLD